MDKLTIFRGIAVGEAEVDSTTVRIQTAGLSGTEGSSTYMLIDLRPHAEQILDNPALYRGAWDRYENFPVVWGCGDAEGASYYALKHNGGERVGRVGLLIEMGLPIDRCFVDCRDFLCTIFQLWDRDGVVARERVRQAVGHLFGDRALAYFDRAAATRDQQARIAFCNLAAHDIEVVRAHHANRTCIGGRFGTAFHSAFAVRAPVLASEIVRVSRANPSAPPCPAVRLPDLLAGG